MGRFWKKYNKNYDIIFPNRKEVSQVPRKNHIRYLTCADRALEVIICTDSTLSYPLHNHISVFTIGLVIKGSLSVTIGQTSHIYGKGQTFIIPPYLPHSIDAADSYTLLSLCIHEELFCRCNYDMHILKACVNKALRSAAVANELSRQQLVQLTDCLDSLSGKAELFRHMGPDEDVPAGDIGVGGREVGYLFGMYKKLTHQFQGVLTGKGQEFGGSLIRPEATGYGNVYFLCNMLATKGIDIKGKTVLVSGSGNVAQYTMEKLLQLGAKPVTCSDSDGYIYDPDGIDREKLDYIMELKNVERGRIKEYAEKYGVKYVAGAKPWFEKADIALPSATQNEINEEAAKALIANGVIAVSEGANMPSTPEAIKVFQDAKILYSPGKAANAGGVAVSGLEMSQNSERLKWSREEVDAKLHDIMNDIHANCVKYGTEPDGYVNYVKGANVAGFLKVAKAMMAQGIV